MIRNRGIIDKAEKKIGEWEQKVEDKLFNGGDEKWEKFYKIIHVMFWPVFVLWLIMALAKIGISIAMVAI